MVCGSGNNAIRGAMPHDDAFERLRCRRRLYLYQKRNIRDHLEHFSQRRHVDAAITVRECSAAIRSEVVARIRVPKLRDSHCSHSTRGASRTFESRVVQHHNLAVGTQPDVKLQRIGSKLHRQLERGKGVLRCFTTRPAMPDHELAVGAQQEVRRPVAPHADPAAPGSVRSSTSPSHCESINASASAKGIAAATASGQRQGPSASLVKYATATAAAPGSSRRTSKSATVANRVRYS